MPPFDPLLADIRFGCGLSPLIPPPADAEALLATLNGPDLAAQRFAIEPFDTFRQRIVLFNEQGRIRRANRGTDREMAAKKAMQVMNRQARRAQMTWLGQTLARRGMTAAPLRERLAGFWADHFTTSGKAALMRRAVSPYVEEAIRPHLSGRFEDLLIAAVTHPVMVIYLDQRGSAGPHSPRGKKGKGGLNENLAREIMELHTLGVGGPYTQTDVRELAELLTGLTFRPTVGRLFRKDMAEPGRETVLGRSYGGRAPGLDDIQAVLRDLARHPATARHLARKLAVHFVSDTPDPGLVGAIEAAFLDSGTDLRAGYAAMLGHPAAWSPVPGNVKPPFDFIASALRALAMPPEAYVALKEKAFRQYIQYPLRLMGHIWEKPVGPDGLPEADSAWISPQGLAARLQWSVSVPQILAGALPDPRDFVDTALGARATPAVQFAARAAESRADGVGLILASPAFQRT
ncbi:DUF1800 domain-containing protein [Salipiger aestuarii]|uniref:DUF1800 domain-containing protein n=1 Tax=Salipiger aestuarii TaxID=568098 RepID=UPI00123A5990|nr:DUF1800 domain-containing protein [Salipiger aestuarii]KAA8611415.1 hypothetical protein AL037_09545 [Salipiger aestuarii]